MNVRILSYNIHHGEGMDKRIDLPRIAEVIKLDVKVDAGKVTAYRARLALSFKYEA